MKKLALVVALAIPAPGCATTARSMVFVEHGLEAGNAAWDTHAEEVLSGCKAEADARGDDDTEAQRKECVGDTQKQDKAIGASIIAAVAALRVFWAAYAAKQDKKNLKAAALDVFNAVANLPVDYFGGLRR